MKKHNPDIYNLDLDPEEQDLSDAIDNAIDQGKLKRVKNIKHKLAIARKAAVNSLRKDKRINIRISNSDLMRLKQKKLLTREFFIKRLLPVFYINMPLAIFQNNFLPTKLIWLSS